MNISRHSFMTLKIGFCSKNSIISKQAAPNSRPIRRQHVNPIDYKQQKKTLIDSGNRARLTTIDFHLRNMETKKFKLRFFTRKMCFPKFFLRQRAS